MDALREILPLIFLVLFGALLQRLRFFEEHTFKQLQNFLLRVTIPCLLFTAFVSMEFDAIHTIVSVGMFFFMVALLLVGVLLYRILPIKHDFFMFYLTTFGFGTVGFPVFLEIFGLENISAMAMLGIGHEVFVAGVFFPAMHMYYNGRGKSGGSLAKAFLTPAMIMLALGALISIGNMRPVIAGNFIGGSILDTISRVGDLTLVIALVLSGYRLQFSDRSCIKTSAMYSALRLVVTIGLGILFKTFFLDLTASPLPLLEHAFYILIFQHSSIMLLVFVGLHRPIEDQVVANNSFVINLVSGIVLFFLYMLIFI